MPSSQLNGFLHVLSSHASKGWCTRASLFLQHALGAKLPRLHQRFLAKNVAQQNFCSRGLFPHIICNPVVYVLRIPEFRQALANCCFKKKLAANIKNQTERRCRHNSSLTWDTRLKTLRINYGHRGTSLEVETSV